MTDSAELSKDEQLLAKLGYKQELGRSWSGFSNFAISFSIISILAGCFTTFYQGWNNGGPVAISWGWPLISAFILIIGFTMSELVSAYPDIRRHLLVGLQDGRTRRGLLHGLAEPDRPARRHRVRRLRCGNVPRPHHQHRQQELRRQLLPHPGVPALRGHPGAGCGHEHLPRSPARGREQHLGLVARGRRRDRDPDPDLHPGHAPERELRLHGADQQLRLQQQQLLVPRAAAGLLAHAVHDHRVRRVGTPVRGDPRRRGRCREGDLAVDLLLGRRRLRPPARIRLRCAGPSQGHLREAAASTSSSRRRCRRAGTSSCCSSPPPGSCSARPRASPALRG